MQRGLSTISKKSYTNIWINEYIVGINMGPSRVVGYKHTVDE